MEKIVTLKDTQYTLTSIPWAKLEQYKQWIMNQRVNLITNTDRVKRITDPDTYATIISKVSNQPVFVEDELISNTSLRKHALVEHCSVNGAPLKQQDLSYGDFIELSQMLLEFSGIVEPRKEKEDFFPKENESQ